MAENIGKIVVSIEAEVKELRSGLAQAEAEFKKSAAKLEEQQNKLGTRFKKSWVELSSKVNVYVMALNAAVKATEVFTESLRILGDESKDALDKTVGILDAFKDSGIPIISQFVSIARGLAEHFSGWSEAMELLLERQNELNKMTREYNKLVQEKATTDSMELQLKLQTSRTKIASLEVLPTGKDKEKIFHERRAMERLVLETRLQKQISSIAHLGLQDRAIASAKATLEQFDYESLQRLNKLGLYLEKQESMEREARERKEKDEKELADRIAQQKIEDAKKVADKTMDLETRLNIMLAKQAGDEEYAQFLAIDARYKKMLEGATGVNREIIRQMRAIELTALDEATYPTASTTAGGGGGTASVGTAIGAFTVATGRTELKKQTNLLRRIANATEKLGEGEVVVLAA